MGTVMNVLRVTNFIKENNLRMTTTNEGLIILDQEGCILFESNSKTRCFSQAAAWIDGNECENLF